MKLKLILAARLLIAIAFVLTLPYVIYSLSGSFLDRDTRFNLGAIAIGLLLWAPYPFVGGLTLYLISLFVKNKAS